MRQSPFRIVLMGSYEPAETPQVAAALSLLPQTASIVRLTAWTEDWLPCVADSHLCIVFETWPDEIPLRTVHALLAACSAGRLVCCQGAWCASAGRTRAAWPPAVCVPIENLSSRIAFELDVLTGRRPPLPATASRDEAFAAHYAIEPGTGSASVVVNSPDPTYARELQRALSSSPPTERRDCIITDTDRSTDNPQHNGNAARIAVAGFPRPEQLIALQTGGLRTIVPKLAPLSELRAAAARSAANQQ